MKRLACLFALTLMPLPALAQTIDAADPMSIVNSLQSHGYQAELGTDSVGDPIIYTSFGGYNGGLYFYGCTNGAACTEVQFIIVGTPANPASVEAVNQWNIDKNTGAASLDSEGMVALRFLVVTRGGIPAASFDRSLELWELAVGEFGPRLGL
jgi:hypothetical protein